YLLWDSFEYAAARSHFTHCAIYEGKGQIIQATQRGDPEYDGVRRADLLAVLNGPTKVAVVRPPYKTAADLAAALDFCRKSLGKPYDKSFLIDDALQEAFDCSSLLYLPFRVFRTQLKGRESKGWVAGL